MAPFTIKELVEMNENAESVEDYTCYECKSWWKCPSAFDSYNIGGECLEEK